MKKLFFVQNISFRVHSSMLKELFLTAASAKDTFTFLSIIVTSQFSIVILPFFLLLPFATKQVFMQSCLAKSSRSFYQFEQTVYDFKAQPKNISKYLYSWSGCLGIPNYSNDEMMKMTIPWGLLCVRYFVCVWWNLHKTLFLSSWNRNFLAL